MPPVLRLYEDVLDNGAEVTLRARPRMIFVAHGAIAMADHGPLRDDEAIGSESAISFKGEPQGATIWVLQTQESAGGHLSWPDISIATSP